MERTLDGKNVFLQVEDDKSGGGGEYSVVFQNPYRSADDFYEGGHSAQATVLSKGGAAA